MLYLNILLQLMLDFISSCLPPTMQQYEDMKISPFKIRHCTTRSFGVIGQHQVP
jgi:hypothetical protein